MYVKSVFRGSVLKTTGAGFAVLAAGLLSAGLCHAQSQTPAQVQPAVGASAQQNAPDATLVFSGGDIAAGIGFSWADGTLTYQGRPYSFHANGLSIADVGAMSVSASGEVYNLRNIADFNGTYAAVSAGATIGGGGGIAYLRNQNGVVIKINSTSQGLNFHLATDGLRMRIEG
jgi:hypothetical protein